MNEAGNELLSRTSWLYTKLVEGPFFFFDLWSLAHLYSGCLVMLVLLALHERSTITTAMMIASSPSETETGSAPASASESAAPTPKDTV